ncbi:hypothetical protein BGZ52_011642, partial [Haplosporangium bisporale]
MSLALLASASSHSNKIHREQQKQKQQHEFILEDPGADIHSKLHKNGGVDFHMDGPPRIDYLHSDALSDHEAKQMDEQPKAEDPQKCLLFSDEFDKLDRSIWR